MRRSVLGLIMVVALLLLAPSARAAQVTGFADENLENWSGPAWSAFNATGVKKVRHIVAWYTAMPGHGSELAEAEAWVDAARAHGLEITISFDHPIVPCDRANPACEFPPSMLAPSPATYREAVIRFRENPKFRDITSYTAWNEPNHHVNPNAHPEQQMNPADNPELAARYWLELNSVCHTPQYGPTCTVAAGDFMDGSNPTGFTNFMKTYRATIGGSSVAIWAVHPYHAVEAGDPSLIDTSFIPYTEGKPVWFTEVGGMFCRTDSGYTGAAGTPQSAEEFQDWSARSLLWLIGHEPQVTQTFYYALSPANGTPTSCSPGNRVWDSNLISANLRRKAFYTLFPGAATPQAPNGIAAIRDQASGQQWVYYVKPDNRLALLAWTGSKWIDGPFGATVRPGTSPSAVRSPVDGQQWVYYVKPDSRLALLAWNGSQWTDNPFGATAMAGTSPSAIRNQADGQQWVYYVKPDGRVALLAWNGSQWTDNPFGATAMAGTSPAAVRDQASGQQWVYYVKPDGRLALLAWTGSQWIDGPFGATVRPGTSPSVVRDPTTGQQWVYYVDAGGGISELWWTGSTWIEDHRGGSVMPGASPSVVRDQASGQRWVYYVNSSDFLTQWWWSGSNWSNNPFGATVIPGSSPVALRDPVTGEQWVYDMSASNGRSVGGVWWNGTIWGEAQPE